VLARLPNVSATPHLGASTAEAEGKLRRDGGRSADRLSPQRQHPQFGELPTVSLERTDGVRIAVTNRNVPKMLGQILSVLANKNINVIDMINKSRADVAYNLIDVAAPIPADLLPEINRIGSVMNVRLFEQ
jgi:D-3-phosphoglycerate dehydrogenase